MQVFPVMSEKKEADEMNGQEQIVAWVGIDWADEAHQVWEYTTSEPGVSKITRSSTVENHCRNG